jgi:hypothetical protein
MSLPSLDEPQHRDIDRMLQEIEEGERRREREALHAFYVGGKTDWTTRIFYSVYAVLLLAVVWKGGALLWHAIMQAHQAR